MGLAATADFSAIPMLAVALPAIYALHRGTRAAPRGAVESRWLARLRVGLTIGTAVVVMWAVYGFGTGRLVDGSWIVLPAPAWFRGFAAFLTDSSVAHPAFLFGERSANGWWYYYPIALLVKTPLLFVVPDAGVRVLPLPAAVTVTLAPLIALPLASFAVTVMVDDPLPAVNEVGAAVTVELVAETPEVPPPLPAEWHGVDPESV